MGYDTSLFVEEPNRHFICSICLDVVKDNLRSECDHLYCRSCIFQALDNKLECPVDRRPLPLHQLKKDTILESVIGELKVKCKKHSQGCTYQINLDNMPAHECEYEFVKCSFRDCDASPPQNKIKDHTSNCIHRSVVCSNCEGSFPFASFEQHVSQCDGTPVTSPLCITKDCEHYGNNSTEGMCSVCYRTKNNISIPTPIVLREEEEKYILKYSIPDINVKQLKSLISAGILRAPKITPIDVFIMLMEMGCRFGRLGIRVKEAQHLIDTLLSVIGNNNDYAFYHAICPFVIDKWNIPETWGVGYCYYGMNVHNTLEGGLKANDAPGPDINLSFINQQAGWTNSTIPVPQPSHEALQFMIGCQIGSIEYEPQSIKLIFCALEAMQPLLVESNYAALVCHLLQIE